MLAKHLFRFCLMLTSAFFITGEVAQAVDFQFSGQIRPRFEFVDEGAQGQALGQSKNHTTMRTRVNVKAIVDDNVSAFVQIQDVRTWGGELSSGPPPSITRTGTSVTASGLDLHQVYLTLNNLLDTGLNLKIGRQEMIFDEHRLIGNIGWIQQGQSFDALRADFGLGELKLTAFIAETLAKDTHPVLGQTVNSNTVESRFYGLRATFGLGGKDRITPYLYYSENPTNTPEGDMQDLGTVGVYFLKNIAGFRVRFDGAYQFGNVTPTRDISAYMATISVGHKLDFGHGANVTLWFDYLSGDDGLDNTRDTFTTPYATNHAYYGHIDKFLSIPARGLMDTAVKFWVKPTEKTKFVLHYHYFYSPETTTAQPDSDLGQEVDLQFHYPLAKSTKLVLGYSRYIGTGTINGGTTGNTTLDTNWAFAMINTNF